MRPTAFILGSSLLLSVSIGPAAAGLCTSEVDKVRQALIGQNPDARLAPSFALNADRSTAMMSRETTGSAPPADSQPDSQGSAGVSGQEPKSQGETQNPAGAALDPKEDIFASHMMAGAISAIERARLLDRQGKESECLSAVGMAKLMSGLR